MNSSSIVYSLLHITIPFTMLQLAQGLALKLHQCLVVQQTVTFLEEVSVTTQYSICMTERVLFMLSLLKQRGIVCSQMLLPRYEDVCCVINDSLLQVIGYFKAINLQTSAPYTPFCPLCIIVTEKYVEFIFPYMTDNLD